MAAVNYLISRILHNIFFYAQEKKKTHTGLEQLKGEYSFGWTFPSIIFVVPEILHIVCICKL